jgi:hypothetical protein
MAAHRPPSERNSVVRPRSFDVSQRSESLFLGGSQGGRLNALGLAGCAAPFGQALARIPPRHVQREEKEAAQGHVGGNPPGVGNQVGFRGIEEECGQPESGSAEEIACPDEDQQAEQDADAHHGVSSKVAVNTRMLSTAWRKKAASSRAPSRATVHGAAGRRTPEAVGSEAADVTARHLR